MKFGIKFVNKINILGIFFSNEHKSDDIAETVDKKIEQLIKMCSLWSKRNIGIIGKITLLKTFGLSLFNYIMQSVGITPKKLKEINSIMYAFLWRTTKDKKPIEKVKRDILCLDYAQGGLKMIDIVNIQDSYLLHWGERLLSEENSHWTSIPLFFYQRIGGRLAFESNACSAEFKGLDLVKSKFWRKVREKWLDTKNNNLDKNECLDRIETINTGEPLFNNVNIKFKGKVILKEKCIRKGIQRIKDVMINDRLISIQESSNIYGNFPDTLSLII